MILPDNFQFSQGSLQDFVDCPRRFYLRYIRKIAWPAVQSEPVMEFEESQKRGQRFHHLLHQGLLGISPEQLESAAEDDARLLQWWRNFISSGFLSLSGEIFPEFYLSLILEEFRLGAKFDLIHVTPEREIHIYDWKTSQKRLSKKWLSGRLQTRVYPFVLSQAGSQFNQNRPLKPDQIQMIYWSSNYPDQMLILPYHEAQMEEDRDFLKNLISRIRSMDVQDFEKTSQEKFCGFCTYRSLCERGIKASDFEEAEDNETDDTAELDFDFDQIAELEF